MNFKKKRRLCDLLRAALIIVLFIGVPIWLLMFCMVTNDLIAWFGLAAWLFISYSVSRRFE